MNAQTPLVILHGWSDHATSFTRLANKLQQRLGRDTHVIHLADYLSMEDAITYDDIVAAMQHAWQAEGLSVTPHSVDMVVHSTGALIVRHWLAKYYDEHSAPIKHLLMLAPANFGSPLAHKGRSFIGRILKGGEGKRLFHVGENLLRGLELASPYTWQLAMQDCFGRQNFYGPGKILCSVLVGDMGYQGLSAAANEVGGDGTIRISTANLNAALLEVDLRDAQQVTHSLSQARGVKAFGIMPGENHSSIAAKDDGPYHQATLEHMETALSIGDDHFQSWCDDLQKHNRQLAVACYQNTVSFVTDQFEFPVYDYLLEFYGKQHQNEVATRFHGEFIRSVHAYQENNAYRSLYINTEAVQQYFEYTPDDLKLNLTATPMFEKNGDVGYPCYDAQDRAQLIISHETLSQVFQAHRSLLVRFVLPRQQSKRVFEIDG